MPRNTLSLYLCRGGRLLFSETSKCPTHVVRSSSITHTRMHIYIYMHTYIHIYIHAFILSLQGRVCRPRLLFSEISKCPTRAVRSSSLTHTHTCRPTCMHTYIHTYMEDQCEWHRMTRMTGPDIAVMCNLINIHTYLPTYMHT